MFDDIFDVLLQNLRILFKAMRTPLDMLRDLQDSDIYLEKVDEEDLPKRYNPYLNEDNNYYNNNDDLWAFWNNIPIRVDSIKIKLESKKTIIDGNEAEVIDE